MSDESQTKSTPEEARSPASELGAGASSPVEDELTPEEEAALAAQEEDAALSSLLKRSLAEPSEASPDGDRELLLKVQSKLRQRSKGKFYADGWSTTHSRVNYLLVAVIMLVTVVAVYLALGPMGISR